MVKATNSYGTRGIYSDHPPPFYKLKYGEEFEGILKKDKNREEFQRGGGRFCRLARIYITLYGAVFDCAVL